VVIAHKEGVTGPELEREFFILRKLMEGEKARRISAAAADQEPPRAGPSAADFYICSLSGKTIVYKVRCLPGLPGVGVHVYTRAQLFRVSV
jgi:glutamate synthase domain-containing protein 1